MVFVYHFKIICWNQNYGLSRTQATFLVRFSSPVSNCNQSQPLLKSVASSNKNEVHKHSNEKKTEEKRGSSASHVTLLIHLRTDRTCCLQIRKYNLTRGNNYRHCLSRLTESVNKTPSGMISETTGVVKTQP